ncbi:MAG: glycosyltransferase family 4 protein [Acidobacteriota bacterium]
MKTPPTGSRPGKPRALLVVPIWPAPSGNGVAMRAFLHLSALARDHRVDIWCIPVAGAQPGPRHHHGAVERSAIAELEVDPGWVLASRAGADALLRLGRPSACRFTAHRAVAELRRGFGPLEYRCVLVYRSYLLPFVEAAEQTPGSLGFRIVDLDDDEATTRRRLAELDLDAASSDRQRLEAELFERFEARHLPWAHRLLAAQEPHAERLRGHFHDVDVDVVPNAVDVPRGDPPIRPVHSGTPDRLHLLLVGTLSYLPNRAAALELALEVVPRLQGAGLGVHLRIIGRRPPADVARLAELEGVEVLADCRDLGPHYAWAHQTVVPLRAGGGTRIKILEAFAAGVPVVATAMAADGLRVEHGDQLLLAESPDALAAEALRLHRSPDLAGRLARSASGWVRRHHDRRRVANRLADRIDGAVERSSGGPPPEATDPS